MTPATAKSAPETSARLARLYARAAGGLLLALGVAGLLSGGDRLFGVLNADPAENTMHLVAGALLLFVGLFQLDAEVVAIATMAVSAALVLVGVVGFFVPTLFGLVPGGLSVADDVLHLVLGAAGIACVQSSRGARGHAQEGGSRR